MKILYALLALPFLFLTSCNDNNSQPVFPPPVGTGNILAPGQWTIGPFIDGKDYSIGMPIHPKQENPGWSFTFPLSDGVHYVDTPGGLNGKSSITMTFEIQAAPNVKVVPTQGGSPNGLVRLYFQRADDDWQRADGRWWSPPTTLAAGTFTVTIPLVFDKWGCVFASQCNAAQFNDAIVHSGRIGMTFGGDFAGHGVYATGPAEFILRSFNLN